MIDITKAKVKDRVRDRWFPDWGTGHVTRILSRNRIEIFFDGLEDVMVFDKPHCQFLEAIPRNPKVRQSRTFARR